jgi:hypothetical protein
MRSGTKHSVQLSAAYTRTYTRSDFASREVQMCQNQYASRLVSLGFTSNTLINRFKFSRLKLLTHSGCQSAVLRKVTV